MSDEELKKKLTAVKGLGPWSVEMYSIFRLWHRTFFRRATLRCGGEWPASSASMMPRRSKSGKRTRSRSGAGQVVVALRDLGHLYYELADVRDCGADSEAPKRAPKRTAKQAAKRTAKQSPKRAPKPKQARKSKKSRYGRGEERRVRVRERETE